MKLEWVDIGQLLTCHIINEIKVFDKKKNLHLKDKKIRNVIFKY